MRGFYQVFARTILDETFANLVFVQASDALEPFKKIKAFCNSYNIRGSAIDVFEIHRVFKNANIEERNPIPTCT